MSFSIALGFLAGVTSYKSATDVHIREFLDNRSMESKKTVMLGQLDKIVQHRPRTDMKENNATIRMQDFF